MTDSPLRLVGVIVIHQTGRHSPEREASWPRPFRRIHREDADELSRVGGVVVPGILFRFPSEVFIRPWYADCLVHLVS